MLLWDFCVLISYDMLLWDFCVLISYDMLFKIFVFWHLKIFSFGGFLCSDILYVVLRFLCFYILRYVALRFLCFYILRYVALRFLCFYILKYVALRFLCFYILRYVVLGFLREIILYLYSFLIQSLKQIVLICFGNQLVLFMLI